MTDDSDLYERFFKCLGLEVKPKKKVMKDFPDDLDLRIMWQVAVSSSLSGQGEAYRIFARLLYQHLTDTGPKITLDEPITKEQYNESKNQSNP